MKRVFILAIAISLLAGCGAVNESPTEALTTEVRSATPPDHINITVISNGTVHEPYMQMIYGTYYHNGMLIHEDGELMLHQIEALPEIAYADDFEIVTSRHAAYEVTVQCALYENDYESIYAVYRNAIGSNPKSIEDFTFPDEAGVYLLNVEMSWRRGEENACYAHVFKIVKS